MLGIVTDEVYQKTDFYTYPYNISINDALVLAIALYTDLPSLHCIKLPTCTFNLTLQIWSTLIFTY